MIHMTSLEQIRINYQNIRNKEKKVLFRSYDIMICKGMYIKINNKYWCKFDTLVI